MERPPVELWKAEHRGLMERGRRIQRGRRERFKLRLGERKRDERKRDKGKVEELSTFSSRVVF